MIGRKSKWVRSILNRVEQRTGVPVLEPRVTHVTRIVASLTLYGLLSFGMCLVFTYNGRWAIGPVALLLWLPRWRHFAQRRLTETGEDALRELMERQELLARYKER